MIDAWFGRGFSLIVLSVYVALIFSIIPMGDWLAYVRPDWVFLLVMFWTFAMPSRFGIWFAFLVGALIDIVGGSLLGMHSLALVLVVFLQMILHRQLKAFSGFQQFIFVFIFSFLYLLILKITESFFAESISRGVAYWLPSFINALIWPWFYIVMDSLRTRFNIYEANG